MNVKETLCLLLCSIPLFYASPLLSEEGSFSPDAESMHLLENIEDSFDFDDDDDPFVGEFLDTVGANQLTRVIDPEAIINLFDQFSVIDALQEDLFLHTNPFNRRSPLDEPIFEPIRIEFPKNWTLGIHTFVRKTDRSNFTAKSTNLSSYLALEEPTLIEKLQAISDNAQQFFTDEFNLDIAKIFSLFKNMTVQERRGGFMFHLMNKWEQATFRFLVPIYYRERNFFLTPEEQDAVEAEFGALDEEEQEKFQRAHFINDRAGIGDTRIEVNKAIIKRPSASIHVGGQATIPTAFTWSKNFKGSSFRKPSDFPTFEFEDIFKLLEAFAQDMASEEEQQRGFDILKDFTLGAFDRIAANLLDTKLGNDGHLGIGIFMRGKARLSSIIDRPWAERIKLVNRISLEYLFPASEKRFFINKINQKEFEKRDFNDPDKAEENLTFLEEQFVEKFFLRAFDTRIQPGVIFRWTSRLTYQGRKWGLNLGTDLWVQDKEKFRSINAPDKALAEIDIAKARPPMARQSKLFGNIVYKIKRPRHTWFISINGDTTASRRGIGQDYALSFNFEAKF